MSFMFDELPLEVKDHVLDFLSAADLLTLRNTSRELNTLANPQLSKRIDKDALAMKLAMVKKLKEGSGTSFLSFSLAEVARVNRTEPDLLTRLATLLVLQDNLTEISDAELQALLDLGIAADDDMFPYLCLHISLDQLHKMVPYIIARTNIGYPFTIESISQDLAPLDHLRVMIEKYFSADKLAIAKQTHQFCSSLGWIPVSPIESDNPVVIANQLIRDLIYLKPDIGEARTNIIFALSLLAEHLQQSHLRLILESVKDESYSSNQDLIRANLIQHFIPYLRGDNLDHFIKFYEFRSCRMANKPALTANQAATLSHKTDELKRKGFTEASSLMEFVVAYVHDEDNQFITEILQQILRNSNNHRDSMYVYRQYSNQFWDKFISCLHQDEDVDLFIDFLVDVFKFWDKPEYKMETSIDHDFDRILTHLAQLERFMNPMRINKLMPVLQGLSHRMRTSKLTEIYGFVIRHGDENQQTCWLRADEFKATEEERNHLQFPIIKVIAKHATTNPEQVAWFHQSLCAYLTTFSNPGVFTLNVAKDYISLFKNIIEHLSVNDRENHISIFFDHLKIYRNQTWYDEVFVNFVADFIAYFSDATKAELTSYLVADLHELKRTGLNDTDTYLIAINAVKIFTHVAPYLSFKQQQGILAELVALAPKRRNDIVSIGDFNYDAYLNSQLINLVTLLIQNREYTDHSDIIKAFKLENDTITNLYQRLFCQIKLNDENKNNPAANTAAFFSPSPSSDGSTHQIKKPRFN